MALDSAVLIAACVLWTLLGFVYGAKHAREKFEREKVARLRWYGVMSAEGLAMFELRVKSARDIVNSGHCTCNKCGTPCIYCKACAIIAVNDSTAYNITTKGA